MIVGDVVLRVPDFHGEFAVSAKSHLFARLLRDGAYEPEYVAQYLLHVRPDIDVVDVGANVGFYTVAAAKRGARVLAIEPTAGAYRRLSENVHRNGVERQVILFNGLASDSSLERVLNVVDGMEEYSSMAPLRVGGGVGLGRPVCTAARTLDSLVTEHGLRPRLIKVDAEGAEALVLRGAMKTLKQHRPVVLAEVSNALLSGFGATGDQIVTLFRDLGYDVRDGAGEPLSAGSDGYGEIVCIPGFASAALEP